MPGSDHFILLCENTSNPPEVLSCCKRFICYVPPTKLVTGSTFHALFFNDAPGELWLQHFQNHCWQTCMSVLLVTFIQSQWSPCPKAENSPSTKLSMGCEGKRPGKYSIVERRPQECQRRGITEGKRQGCIKDSHWKTWDPRPEETAQGCRVFSF